MTEEEFANAVLEQVRLLPPALLRFIDAEGIEITVREKLTPEELEELNSERASKGLPPVGMIYGRFTRCRCGNSCFLPYITVFHFGMDYAGESAFMIGARIRETLLHELSHAQGMNEKEALEIGNSNRIPRPTRGR